MSIGEFHVFCAHQQDVVCNQKYDNNLPYSFHLECGREEARQWTMEFSFDNFDTETVLCGAMGHDLQEDARLTYNDIVQKTGKEIADIIYACTEDKGKSRGERHSDAYYDGLRENRLATFVKLCDIIANVKFSMLTNSTMLDKYRSEFPRVKKELYRYEFDGMFLYLENLLNLG
jgi:(p)ppGpp synthase/HD superfamily hydrolase